MVTDLDTELDDEKIEHKYSVISVEKTDPPKGISEGNWHHYVIGKGKSIIDGLQQGSLASVTQYAEDFADGLNDRSEHFKPIYATRKRK